ncbi:MAG: tryptophan--tRNA ligase [Planctomycetota bacterium]|nr:MAG: tryptophan--tRNA ligase [Planctomycetota bacterium]
MEKKEKKDSTIKRVLSGIKPTAAPHIGNYLAMIRPAIELQDEFDCFYFVADYHSLTTLRDRAKLKEYTYELVATFLALGLDPQKATFFRHSDVPEVTELTWILNCVCPLGLLMRAHAYKAAKDEGREEDVNAGLFDYPVLMAADILIYDSHLVPVGKDQLQHIEITRDLAGKFNRIFGDTFIMPEALVKEEVMTIPGLDGRKMSKSYGNTIEIFMPPNQLKKRIMSIVTDSTPIEEPKNPEKCNVFQLYKLFASKEEVENMQERYLKGGLGYGEAKQALFEVMDQHLKPYREKYEKLKKDRKYLESILAEGAKKARKIAWKVMDRVRRRVGLGRYLR